MIERAVAELVARHGTDVLGEVDILLTHSQLPDLPILGAAVRSPNGWISTPSGSSTCTTAGARRSC